MKKRDLVGMVNLVVILPLLGIVACSGIQAPERDDGAPLQTDALSYSLTKMGDWLATPPIELTLTNTTGAPAFVHARVEVVVEGLENGEWVTRYSRSTPDPFVGMIPLDPGESMSFETTIEGFLPGTCECHPIVDLEDGIYRFRIVKSYVDSFDEETWEMGDELALEFRVSNGFTLDAP